MVEPIIYIKCSRDQLTLPNLSRTCIPARLHMQPDNASDQGVYNLGGDFYI